MKPQISSQGFPKTSSMNIRTVNLLFSTLVFWVAAKIYLLPRLHELKPKTVLLPILLLHSLNHPASEFRGQVCTAVA
jgi:hypothetical protein